MAFFRTVSSSDLIPAITGDGVVLRAPQMSDCAECTLFPYTTLFRYRKSVV